MSSDDICQACGRIVKTPIKCSNCDAVFHRSCVYKKKKYRCPKCGHESDKHELRFG